MMLGLALALVSGCVNSSYCDVAKPLYFGDQATIDWLLENDIELLRPIVVHNETYEGLCASGRLIR